MDPTSSLRRIRLGENVYGSSSEKIEGHGDWNAPEYTDTTGSNQKKVTKSLSFYKMDTGEVSERYIAPCFVNGLEAYNGEINLAFNKNLISNEYVVKLCLDYEVKKGNKEDDVKPRVIFGWSFMRIVNGIVNFSSGVIIVYPEEDPFKDDYEKTEKRKSSRNKKKSMENLKLFYLDIGTSSSTMRHLIQVEAAKEALALRIIQKFALLEEVGQVLETMAYHDKLKGKVNENALADTGLDINTMPYRIYEQLGREGIKKAERSLALQAVINPFWKISVWKEAISFLGSLHVPLQHPGVPRVGIPRPPRASMQDLYEKMSNTEIRQGAIERMSYRQSYHWDMYVGVFEHMVGVYSVPLQGAYNPPGYAQPQQYPPQPLQQQQQNDDE
nr:hypothetical protein [Tanacetum cinerariifolium]